MSLPDDAEDADDRGARRAAQTGFAAPLVVEAGAGTGKTTTLVARVLAWCLGPGWERSRRGARGAPRSRRRATSRPAVLSRRRRHHVHRSGGGRDGGPLRRRGGPARRAGGETPRRGSRRRPPRRPGAGAPRPRAARRLDRLAVRTIHAFCRRLLAAHPLEAGLHPELTVDADGRALAQVAREVVEARLARGYGEPGDPHLLALAGAGYGPQEIVEALIELVARRAAGRGARPRIRCGRPRRRRAPPPSRARSRRAPRARRPPARRRAADDERRGPEPAAWPRSPPASGGRPPRRPTSRRSAPGSTRPCRRSSSTA